MSAKRLTMDAALGIVMGVAVAMVVAVRSDFRRYRESGRMEMLSAIVHPAAAFERGLCRQGRSHNDEEAALRTK